MRRVNCSLDERTFMRFIPALVELRRLENRRRQGLWHSGTVSVGMDHILIQQQAFWVGKHPLLGSTNEPLAFMTIISCIALVAGVG